MRKGFGLLLIALLGLCLLSGCGRGEEEKRQSEQQNQQNQQELSEQEREALRASLKENELLTLTEAGEALYDLIASDAGAVTRESVAEAVDAFNSAYDAYLEKAVSSGAYDSEEEASAVISGPISTKISDMEQSLLMACFDYASDERYGCSMINRDSGDYFLYFTSDDHMDNTIIKADGREIEIDLTSYVQDVSYVGELRLDGKKVTFGVQHLDADYLYYIFDLTEDPVSMTSGTERPEVDYSYEMIQLDLESIYRYFHS